MEIGKDKLPHYIYYLPKIKSNINYLKEKFDSVDELYYSVKANHNLQVLKTLNNLVYIINTF